MMKNKPFPSRSSNSLGCYFAEIKSTRLATINVFPSKLKLHGELKQIFFNLSTSQPIRHGRNREIEQWNLEHSSERISKAFYLSLHFQDNAL